MASQLATLPWTLQPSGTCCYQIACLSAGISASSTSCQHRSNVLPPSTSEAHLSWGILQRVSWWSRFVKLASIQSSNLENLWWANFSNLKTCLNNQESFQSYHLRSKTFLLSIFLPGLLMRGADGRTCEVSAHHHAILLSTLVWGSIFGHRPPILKSWY